MAIALISWVANYAYAESNKLAEPVFFDHYYDFRPNELTFQTFYYVANKEDKEAPWSVELGDWQGQIEPGYPNEVYDIETFGRYALRSFTVQFPDYPEVEKLERFKEMTVHFTERSVIVPIGEVVMKPPQQGRGAFAETMHSGGRYNRAVLVPEEDLTITAVHTSFDEQLEDQFFIKLHSAKNPLVVKPGVEEAGPDEAFWQKAPGIDARTVEFPFTIPAGEPFVVSMMDEVKPRAALELDLLIEGMEASGEPFIWTEVYQSQPQFTKQEIKQLIKKRTEAKANE